MYLNVVVSKVTIVYSLICRASSVGRMGLAYHKKNAFKGTKTTHSRKLFIIQSIVVGL